MLINKNYEKVFRVGSNDTEISNKQLKSKIRNLQRQLRRCKSKIANMSDVIDSLEQNLTVKTEIADRLRASFDKLQLSIFNNTKNNTTICPCGRRYTDDVKEFSLTLYFYPPKAYEYVRSIIPLPNPSLIRKWSSSVDCELGFLQEAFQSWMALEKAADAGLRVWSITADGTSVNISTFTQLGCIFGTIQRTTLW